MLKNKRLKTYFECEPCHQEKRFEEFAQSDDFPYKDIVNKISIVADLYPLRIIKYIKSLIEEFDNYRPFGDKRDLEMIGRCEKEGELRCIIHINQHNKNYNEVENLHILCENCVQLGISLFKRYHYAQNATFKKGDIVRITYFANNGIGEALWVDIQEQLKESQYKGILINQPRYDHPNNLMQGVEVVFKKDQGTAYKQASEPGFVTVSQEVKDFLKRAVSKKANSK